MPLSGRSAKLIRNPKPKNTVCTAFLGFGLRIDWVSLVSVVYCRFLSLQECELNVSNFDTCSVTHVTLRTGYAFSAKLCSKLRSVRYAIYYRPVLFLLRGPKLGFSPRRGDMLPR